MMRQKAEDTLNIAVRKGLSEEVAFEQRTN